MTNIEKARLLALFVPVGLLAGALGSQYVGGLHPCEMCHWQRWPHYAAVVIAVAAFGLRDRPDAGVGLIRLAALAILTSGLIGAYHAGVELHIFQGFTQCTSTGSGGGSTQDILADIMATPLIRCDQVQWAFLGISMAGWNAIISIGSALVIGLLSLKRPRATAAA